VAIAGALVAAPAAQHAFAAPERPTTVTTQTHETAQSARQGAKPATAALDSISTRAITVASATTARHAAQVKSSHYQVRSGDSLSKIAERVYDKAADWGYVWHENAKAVSDPNLIYVGETLFIPAIVPADYKLADYLPKHAAPVAATFEDSTSPRSNTGDGGAVVVQSAKQGNSTGSTGRLSGTLGCSGLEQLWEEAGGDPAHAFMAAEIAMAESSGDQYALSPTDDYGYWQINISNGALATFNAYGNARSAIILSNDGTNWSPWTTYTEGLYVGKC
jgi:LysM repeat protein